MSVSASIAVANESALSATTSRTMTLIEAAGATPMSLVATATTGDVGVTAIATTATAAVGFGVAAGPVSAVSISQASRAQAMLRLALCAYVEDDIAPSYFEAPLQFAWYVGDLREVPSGAAGAAVVEGFARRNGAGLLSGVAIALVAGAWWALFHRGVPPPQDSSANNDGPINDSYRRTRHWLSVTLAVLLAFLLPNMITSLVLAVGNAKALLPGGSGAAATVGIAAGALVAGVVPLCLVVFVLMTSFERHCTVEGESAPHEPVTGPSSFSSRSSLTFSDADATVPFAAHFLPFFDAARAPLALPSTRVYFVEDVAVAVALGGLAGARPGGGGCLPVAVLALVFSLAHAAYVGFVRPFRTRLESVFAAALAAAQLASATIAAVSAAEARGTTLWQRRVLADKWVAYLGWLYVAQLLLLFAQPVVLLAWLACRRAHSLRRAGDDATPAGGTALSVPLAEGAADAAPQRNPLRAADRASQ